MIPRELEAGGFRGGPLWAFQEVGSTMDVAREAPPVGKPLTVVAATQTAGRGRYDRVWVSPPSGGLYFTVRIPWSRPIAQAPLVSMGAALALARVARKEGCRDVVLKWPNDLLVDGSKCAGLLAEMSSTPDGQALMVGIGLNVSTDERILSRIDQPAISLSLATGRLLDPDEILEQVLAAWTDIDLALEHSGFPALAEEYREYSDLGGREFRLATPSSEERVRFDRINDDGSLSVRRADGSLFVTYGGELLSPNH
jgi:BirA family biotin operon repressor/biotin-[acetyl-CoA-carboxylase] ligase